MSGIILLFGAFWLGRISVENRSSEPKSNLPPQKPEKPDNSEPSPVNKNEGKFNYGALFKDKNNVDWHAFEDIYHQGKDKNWKIIHINQEHPRIKELLRAGKLKRGREFIIRYGKVDEKIKEIYYIFNEFNQDLEITEV